MREAEKSFFVRLSAHGVARLLITSYFMALGFGLIDGADVGVLFMPFVEQPIAGLLAGALVVALSSMVLFGIYRLPATLVLALAIFWASYLTMVVQTGHADVGGFWRDLALIAGLLLTRGEDTSSLTITPFGFLSTASGTERRSEHIVKVRKPRENLPEETGSHVQDTARPGHTRRVRSEIYRQDFEVVRVS